MPEQHDVRMCRGHLVDGAEHSDRADRESIYAADKLIEFLVRPFRLIAGFKEKIGENVRSSA